MSTIQFQIQADYDSLQQFLTGVTERAVWNASFKAGNTTLRRTGTDANRRVRAERKMKAKSVRERLNLVTASSRSREGKSAGARWRLRVSGAPVPLYQYGARQTKRGVSVNVSGRREILDKNAFIATMPSGHTGVFERTGRKRLPIEELFSTKVSDVFQNTGFIPRTQQFFQERFTEEWRRLVPVEIDRAKARARRSRRR